MTYSQWRSSSTIPNIEMREYERTKKLSELITGKSIALVCPSPHLIGIGGGSLIESYDIACRAGNLRFNSAEQSCDYGKRTDILIHSFNNLEISEAKRNLDFVDSSKYVLCPMVSTNFINEHEDFFDLLRQRGNEVENVSDNVLFHEYQKVGTICNVGFAGLLILLKYDIKEVYLTGMSFYNMGKFGKVYSPEYYDMVTQGIKVCDANEEKETSHEQARSDIHNQFAQIEYLRKLVASDPRIKLDSYLQNNLWF